MNRPRLALIGSTAAATLVWLIPPKAECAAEGTEGNEDEEISKEVDAVEKVILNTVGPLLTKLGYGGVMGFFSGLAMKKVGQIAAFFVGIGFIAVQVLQHEGVIQVDFLEVKEKAIEVFDADGDGELTAKDKDGKTALTIARDEKHDAVASGVSCSVALAKSSSAMPAPLSLA